MESQQSQNLMIIVAPNEVRQKLSRQFDLAGLGVQWCDNIYKAMATIFSLINDSASDTETLTVLAWIDNLSYSQLRFFSILAKNGNIVPIAFSDFSQEKLGNSVELGALRGILTEEVPATLLRYIRNKNEQTIAKVDNKKDFAENNFSEFENKLQSQPDQPSPKANWSELDVSLTSEELDSLLLDDQQEMGY